MPVIEGPLASTECNFLLFQGTAGCRWRPPGARAEKLHWGQNGLLEYSVLWKAFVDLRDLPELLLDLKNTVFCRYIKLFLSIYA